MGLLYDRSSGSHNQSPFLGGVFLSVISSTISHDTIPIRCSLKNSITLWAVSLFRTKTALFRIFLITELTGFKYASLLQHAQLARVPKKASGYRRLVVISQAIPFLFSTSQLRSRNLSEHFLAYCALSKFEFLSFSHKFLW